MTSYRTQSRYSDGTFPAASHHRFAAVDSHFGEFPPLYSDLPFSRRKRRGGDNDVVKWAMRVVLASPILVLCLWTIGAVLFTNKHVSNNTNSSSRLQQRQVQQQPQLSSQQTAPMIMMMPQQAQPLMSLSQQQAQQQMMIPLQQAAPNQLQQAAPNQLQQAAPFALQQAAPNALQEAAPLPLQATAQQAEPMATLQEPALQATSQQNAPMLSASQATASPIASPMRKNAKTRPVDHHRPMPRTPLAQQPEQALPAQQLQQPPPQLRHQQPQQILYYDPKEAMANGRLEVPVVVYDQHGNPIPLQQLGGARIVMQPPLQEQEAPMRKLSAADVPKWGESTSQDQSIIVATVAVMALLVGALSARRMRARNVLAACIENESLEDDVAYDTAYTTSQKDNSYYNTFASGGWKGDLEKFDV